MKTRTKIISHCILLALILISSGCATKIKTTMLAPAKSHEASTLKRIAVLPFSGRGARNLNADIEALLVKIRVNGKPYFSVVERSAMRKILREQAFHLSGAVDQKTAVKIGRLLGAEGVILGTVTLSTTENKRYSERRSKCVSEDKDGKCKKRRQYTLEFSKNSSLII